MISLGTNEMTNGHRIFFKKLLLGSNCITKTAKIAILAKNVIFAYLIAELSSKMAPASHSLRSSKFFSGNKDIVN